jgi:hypothetical protein
MSAPNTTNKTKGTSYNLNANVEKGFHFTAAYINLRDWKKVSISTYRSVK